MFRRRTPAYRDYRGHSIPGSVATLEEVTLGGIPQWVLVRGIDQEQPVLLYLHGGPGSAEIATARQHQTELERAFVVVNWDQRGAGLSFRPDIPPDSMTIDQLVSDTVELGRWVARRFDRDRIVLAGHSWGSILGLMAVQKAPELFDAYVGVSQVVDPMESDRRMYQWSLEEAGRRANRRAFQELQHAGPPPYATPGSFRTVRRWVSRFGGRMHHGSESRFALNALGHLSEYTLIDLYRWSRGEAFSVSRLISQAQGVDLSATISEVKVPTYFISGRYDRICDPHLAREYLQALEAPRKGWAWIEDAAHLAPFEQPDAVAAAIAHFSREATTVTGPSWKIAG